MNGKPLQWRALGGLLFVQAQGEQAKSYSFEVRDGKLNVAGADLNGIVTLTRGTAAADAARARQKAAPAAAKTAALGSGQELVGKWCKMR